jgi:hypothetical protein
VKADGDDLALALSAPAQYRAEYNSDPPRLILDLIGVRNELKADVIPAPAPRIARIEARAWPGEPPILRLVIHLQSPATYTIFAQAPGIVVRFLFPSDLKSP